MKELIEQAKKYTYIREHILSEMIKTSNEIKYFKDKCKIVDGNDHDILSEFDSKIDRLQYKVEILSSLLIA